VTTEQKAGAAQDELLAWLEREDVANDGPSRHTAANIRAQAEEIARLRERLSAAESQKEYLREQIADAARQEPTTWCVESVHSGDTHVIEIFDTERDAVMHATFNGGVANPLYLSPIPAGDAVSVPLVPTEAMLTAARDWSFHKYGKSIGDDAAIGCYNAMLNARPV